MRNELKITTGCVESLLDKRFVRVYDLKYAPGRHYYDATRRKADDLVACMEEEKFQHMPPDAVSCVVILNIRDRDPLLLLSYEYRYPIGRFVLSIPAGLIDEQDKAADDAAIIAAKREIKEETGLELTEDDRISIISPLLFSTPGLSDESNALACAVVSRDELPELNQAGAVDGEMFDGFCLTTLEEAGEYLKTGRDRYGRFFSIYTWAALMWFVNGCWKPDTEGK
ncbi:MAG: NUDIX hydrolase [Clostridiales bacterium]|nr:NUDIX hydrolase [Clostridiales bacterium]